MQCQQLSLGLIDSKLGLQTFGVISLIPKIHFSFHRWKGFSSKYTLLSVNLFFLLVQKLSQLLLTLVLTLRIGSYHILDPPNFSLSHVFSFPTRRRLGASKLSAYKKKTSQHEKELQAASSLVHKCPEREKSETRWMSATLRRTEPSVTCSSLELFLTSDSTPKCKTLSRKFSNSPELGQNSL